MPGTKVKKSWALLLALPLTACVEAPPTTPSQVEIAPQSLGLGAEAAPRPDAEWWKAFDDPQVDRLAAQLLAGNPTLPARWRASAPPRRNCRWRAPRTFPRSIWTAGPAQLFSKDYIIPPPFGGSWHWFGR